VADEETKVYALNLFDIADREEYLAYSRRPAREVARRGGRVLACMSLTVATIANSA